MGFTVLPLSKMKQRLAFALAKPSLLQLFAALLSVSLAKT
ncbi:putative membrane protein [Rhodoferax antarcticus ANT.BR]|uniref:Putative membrane protein n=1 Tax=Rhodoferax antarcticus ANT.BR TaxID=1111071 RepID=A0A1Q8Y9B0_9BURK|nr:putative membrane protein [Rhodoferax antarcticus ANT.BR]